MSFQSQYQVSFNETDLINQIQANKQNRMVKYRDTFTFEKKSFLNNSLPSETNSYNNFENYETSRPSTNQQYKLQEEQQQHTSVPIATSRIHTATNTSRIDKYKSIALNLPNQDSNTVYNQHFNYVGAEPHISERIKVYDGAFGPKPEEITQAYKFGPMNNISAKSIRSIESEGSNRVKSYSYNAGNTSRLQSASSKPQNDSFVPSIALPSQNDARQPYSSHLVPSATITTTTALPPNTSQNYLYSSIHDRPNIRSYDFRPVWIPKKYPGRNMFYSHLDSSIFPGKYDVTEQVWNSLEQVNETNREKTTSNSKLDQLISNVAKTEYQQIRVPSFTKNSGFIIHSLDKSILPTVKTDHVKAAEITKTNKFTDNSLYHYS